MPGEFEPHEGCVMIWPERPGSWNYGAREAQKAFVKVAEAIGESEKVYMLVSKAQMENAKNQLGNVSGVTYPLYKLDTSSESHPFYTGAQTRIVEAGRVEKFRAKFAAKKQALDAAAEAAKAK